MSILDGIVGWGRDDPGRTALTDGDEAYTYADALAIASALATGILERDPDGSRPVAVWSDRGALPVVGAVGALLAGRPFVALEATDPPSRVRSVVARAGARVVVDATRAAPEGGVDVPGAQVIRLAEVGHAASVPGVADVPVVADDDPFCIIFTSGSTGRPKGVLHGHGGFAALAPLHANATRAAVRASTAPLSFLAGTYALIDLYRGQTIHRFDVPRRGPAAFAHWIAEHGFDHLSMTPSLARAVAEQLPAGRRLDCVRSVRTSAEALHWADVTSFRSCFAPDVRVQTSYGSSEAPRVLNWYIEADEPIGDGLVPLGVEVRPDRVHLDRTVAASAEDVGEIVVRGEVLALGYWDDPELTARRFGRDRDGTRFYRTGDLAVVDADGCHHFRGRVDDAVKIRGLLVEPAEAEQVLRTLPSVRDAAVVPQQGAGNRSRLVAHVVVDDDVTAPGLRRALRDRLPAQLVPAVVVRHDSLPRTERQKVDRTALRALDSGAWPSPGRLPRSELERAVAGAFRAVLVLPDAFEVKAEDDFWDLGGDSLAAQELAAHLAERTGRDLPLAQLAAGATVEHIAVALDRADRPTGLAVTLNETGTARPIFCVAGGGGTAVAFRSLAAALGPDQPLVVLEANGLHARGLPDWTVEAAAKRFVPLVRARQPHGPYVLAGYSYGGLVAYELGQRLAAAGEPVDSVALLDTGTSEGDLRAHRAALLGGMQEPGHRFRRARRLVQVVTAGWNPRPSAEYYGRFLHIAKLATRRYRPAPATFPVVLVRTGPTSEGPWPSLTSELRLVAVGGTHASFLDPPHVEAVARALLGRHATAAG